MHGLGMVAMVLAAATGAGELPEPTMPVHIEISGSPSFSAEELAQALAPRLPLGAPAGTLSVSVRADGLVELGWLSRKRVVDLGEEAGPAAARVAALLAADLLPATLAAPAPSPPIMLASAPAAPAEPVGVVSFAVGYGVWSGDGKSPLPGVTVTAGLDRTHLRLRAEAGRVRGELSALLDMTAWPLRLGAGLGLSYVSLLGSLAVVPYQRGGVAHATRTLIGGGLGLEGAFPIGAGFGLRAQVGVDRYVGRRLEVAQNGVTFFASPSWAAGVGAALAWGRMR